MGSRERSYLEGTPQAEDFISLISGLEVMLTVLEKHEQVDWAMALVFQSKNTISSNE